MRNYVLKSQGPISLIEQETDKGNLNYMVDYSDKNVGKTVIFTKDKDKAIKVYEKCSLYEKITNTDIEILNKLSNVSSVYGSALISDEEMLGRAEDLINYFKNELAHIDEYYPEPEDEEQKNFFKESSEGLIESLKLDRSSVEPVYLCLHPMSGWYEETDLEGEIEAIKDRIEEIEERINDLEEIEKIDMYNIQDRFLNSDYSHLQKGIAEEIIFQAGQMEDEEIFDRRTIDNLDTLESLVSKVLDSDNFWETLNNQITSNLRELQEKQAQLEDEEEM